MLWLQTHSRSLFLSVFLFSPLSSDSNGLGECSCDSVALRQKVAALWMWGEREKKRDCFQIAQAPKKKETLFSFPTWPTRKKISRRRQRLQRKGMGKIAGHSAKKWICLVWEPAWRGWAEAWKVSQRKFSTNWNKTKKNYKKRIKLKIRRKKKRLNAQVGDEVYFVIRKGESSLRYTQRLSSSDIKLQFLFCLFMF